MPLVVELASPLTYTVTARLSSDRSLDLVSRLWLAYLSPAESEVQTGVSNYRIGDGTLVFFNREDYVVVDPVHETAEQAGRINRISEAQFLGCFDWVGGNDCLQFVPPSKAAIWYGLAQH